MHEDAAAWPWSRTGVLELSLRHTMTLAPNTNETRTQTCCKHGGSLMTASKVFKIFCLFLISTRSLMMGNLRFFTKKTTQEEYFYIGSMTNSIWMIGMKRNVRSWDSTNLTLLSFSMHWDFRIDLLFSGDCLFLNGRPLQHVETTCFALWIHWYGDAFWKESNWTLFDLQSRFRLCLPETPTLFRFLLVKL